MMKLKFEGTAEPTLEPCQAESSREFIRRDHEIQSS
jgi:hypothetical protein